MHVFVCALQAPGIDQSVLNEELFAVAEEFGLDRRSGWQTASPSGRVLAAGVHHSADVARARSYVHLAERSATWFDGLPVATAQIAFDERDAAQLDRNWQALPEGLEGQFSAIRLDLERDRAEVLLDPLGLVPVFVAQTADGGHLLSNSLVLLTRLLGAYQPDPCGVSTFVAIGWAADRRTLIDGISVLRGGAVHRIGDGRVDSTAHFGPEVLAQRPRGSGDAREVAEQMAAMMGSACRGFDLVQCALTGGRDSRLLLALLLEAGVDVQYYTIGERGDPDIDIAVEMARKMELDYYLTTVDEINPGIDWSDAADSFLARVDGLASLDQLRDHLELTEPLSRLDLKLWGVGGEMGRAGTGNLVPLASNVPLLRHSTGYQHRLLAAKARDEGLLTPAGRSLVDGSIRDFLAKRQEEGWMSYELGESFYVFERTGCWGMTGPRRTAVTADLFSAFITRPFLDYAFSMKTGARYVEVPHYSLMSALSPKLRDIPYLSAWHPQHPRLAGAMAAQQFAITLWRRLHAAEALSTEGSEKRVEAEGSFVNGWLESRLELVRDVCLQDSGPWDLIDRRRLEALLTGAPEERLASWYSLVRAVSVCWFLNRTLTLQSAHPPQVAVRS